MSTTTKPDYAMAHAEAHRAGQAAAQAAVPTPMGVTDGAQSWVVPDGPCGFAWVSVHGDRKFYNWAKRNGWSHDSYAGGYRLWISGYGQSMTRKEAYAQAYASSLLQSCVLQGSASCHACSRMD